MLFAKVLKYVTLAVNNRIKNIKSIKNESRQKCEKNIVGYERLFINSLGYTSKEDPIAILQCAII